MLKITDQSITTKGNYGLFPAGQAVFSAPTTKKTPTINVLPGQLVIYNPKTNLSLGATTAAAHPEFVLAVGVDTNGDGATDELRGAAGQKVVGCAISEVNATAPRCGAPAIQDLLFSCIDPNEPYSVKITAWDSTVRATHDYNRRAEFVFTRSVTTGGCDGCDTKDYAKQLACDLRDAINGKKPAGWKVEKNGRFIDPVELPFSAANLYPISQVWCLSAAPADECEDCFAVDALTGISIGDGEDAVVTEFTNTVDPRDDERTLTAQLAGIVEQINVALGGNGTAQLVSSGAPCCPVSIEINTCLEDVVLLDFEGEPLTPCDEGYNPLQVTAPVSNCKDCEEDSNGTLTFPAGLRIIGKPVDVATGCYIPDPGDTNIARFVEIFPYDGFRDGTFHIVDVQRAVNATQQGFQLIHREYRQDLSGPGRNYRDYNSSSGRYNLPLAKDRLNSTLINQKRAYCVFNLEHTIPNNGLSYHGDKAGPKLRTRINVPQGDTVTHIALAAWLSSYASSTPCNTVSISCA
jgi:hypothetical protein